MRRQMDSGDTSVLRASISRCAKSMDVSVGSGDVEMTVPNSTGFKASLTLGSGDFESDFLPLDYDGETILNLEFDNGDKSATYRFEVGSGDMSFDSE